MQNWKLSWNIYALLHTRFCTFGADFVCSVGAYKQKFLHRSSGGSLLRVRCWLGSGSRHKRFFFPFFFHRQIRLSTTTSPLQLPHLARDGGGEGGGAGAGRGRSGLRLHTRVGNKGKELIPPKNTGKWGVCSQKKGGRKRNQNMLPCMYPH